MSSCLAVFSTLTIAFGLQTASHPEPGETIGCIKFYVSSENTKSEAVENETKIIQLTPAGTESLRKITAENVGKNLCIYDGDEVLVAAEIRAEIDSGKLVLQPPE